jgi:hypothetical protein
VAVLQGWAGEGWISSSWLGVAAGQARLGSSRVEEGWISSWLGVVAGQASQLGRAGLEGSYQGDLRY